MTTGSTVKSQARSERAKALIAAMPRDPATGRVLPRSQPAPDRSSSGPDESGDRSATSGGRSTQPAGGPAARPFGERGIHRSRRLR